MSPALAGRFFFLPLAPPEKPKKIERGPFGWDLTRSLVLQVLCCRLDFLGNRRYPELRVQGVCVFGINASGKEATWGQRERKRPLRTLLFWGQIGRTFVLSSLVIRRGPPWEGYDPGWGALCRWNEAWERSQIQTGCHKCGRGQQGLSRQWFSLSIPVNPLAAVVSDSFATLWIGDCQAPLSLGYPRQEDWSGLLCSPPGELPNPGMETASLKSPALAAWFFSTPWKALAHPWCHPSPFFGYTWGAVTKAAGGLCA